MFYIVDFLKEYGVVVLTMSIGWLATCLHSRYEKSKYAKDLRADVLRTMAIAKRQGMHLDKEIQDIQHMLDATGGDSPDSAVSKANAERFERYAFVHMRRRQMQRELAALEEQERELGTTR